MSGLLPRASAAERGMVMLLVTVCSVIVVGAAGTSLWLRVSADDLVTRLFSQAPHAATQLQVTYDGVSDVRVSPSDGEAVEQALGGGLREALTGPRSAVVTDAMVPELLPRRPGQPSYLAVAALPDSDELVEIVSGRMPRPGSATRPLPTRVAGSFDGPAETSVVEVVLEVSASRALEMPVGAWVALSSPSYQGSLPPPALLRVVGTFHAAGPSPTGLDDVDALRKPSISILPELNLVRATALAADDLTVLGARWVDEPAVRWTFDLAGTPSAADVEQLVGEGREAELQEWPAVADATTVSASTNIGDLAQEALDRRRASDGVTTLAVMVVATAALTVLLAAALVLAGRRDPVTTVVRARGAATSWLALRRGGESLLLVAPGSLLAVLGVGLTVGRVPPAVDLLVMLLAALACAAVVTSAQALPRQEATGSPLRAVVGDALQLVAVALAATVTLLVLLDDALAPGDPLLLVLPPLLGTAAAVVVVRTLQAVLGALRRTVRRGRRAVPVVSLSQAVSLARTVAVASTAVVLALSGAMLAVAAVDTVQRGAERAGWEAVGADIGVTAGGLDDDAVDRVASLPGVGTVAGVFTAASVSLDTRTGVEGVQLIGVDPDALAAVAGEGALRGLDLSPRRDGALAGVASTDLAFDDGRGVLRYAQSLVDVDVVGQLDEIPGVTDGGSFLLVDLARFEAAVGRDLESYGTLLVAGDAPGDAVAAVVREDDPQATVRTRAEVTQDLLAGPGVARTRATLSVAAAAAGVLALFAVLLTVALGAPERRRTANVMVAIGADRRQALRSGAWALAPVLVAAGLAATACAVVLGAVAGSGFDLGGLAGTGGSLPVRPDATTSLLAGGGTAALVLVAVRAAQGRTGRGTQPPDPSEPAPPENR